MSKFIVTIETQGTSFYEPEGADIYLVLSGAFEGSLVTVEAAEQERVPDAAESRPLKWSEQDYSDLRLHGVGE